MTEDELKVYRDFVTATQDDPGPLAHGMARLLAEVETLRANLAVECETTAHLSARIAELEEALQQRQQ